MVELNLGTNQIAKLPDDIANLQNLEVRELFTNYYMIITKINFQSKGPKGSFFLKSSESFVISSNTRTFYFCASQFKPLQASKLSNYVEGILNF